MFRKQKTIEAASFLIGILDPEGTGIPYIKLIKLLYIADREMLRRKRHTLTGDDHWAMKYGPVLGKTLELIKGTDADWSQHFRTDLDAKVISAAGRESLGALSRVDHAVLKEVADSHGHLPWQDLVELTHEFPEWKPVNKGRLRISLWDMAKAVGFSDGEAKEVVEYNAELREIQQFQDQIRALGVPA
ncbi:MAG: Panacea domain-containing protein [Fimbriimonas sp.]